MLIQAADVQRCWNDNLRLQLRQLFGKFQAGVADVDRAVDVRAANVQQLSCPGHVCHAGDDGHGHPGSRAVFSM